MDEHQSNSHTVRSNWLRFSWNQISGANKVMLILSFSLSSLQIIVTSIILGIGGSLRITCDKPLQLYLIIFVIRVGISIPFTVYQHLSIPRRSTTEQNTLLLNTWTDRIKSILDLFAILWFMVGNYLVFSPSDCSYNAATYFYTVLTWVLFGYLILLIPVLIFISVIFCLPCVLGTVVVVMRTFNINVSQSTGGGAKEDILKIPTFQYKTNTLTTFKKSSLFQQLFSTSFIKTDPTAQYQNITLSPFLEDPSCSICLCTYEENDLICKLWCKHHFHRDCVHEWLGLNSTCPLCKRDFRGKDYIQSNSTTEEDQY